MIHKTNDSKKKKKKKKKMRHLDIAYIVIPLLYHLGHLPFLLSAPINFKNISLLRKYTRLIQYL